MIGFFYAILISSWFLNMIVHNHVIMMIFYHAKGINDQCVGKFFNSGPRVSHCLWAWVYWKGNVSRLLSNKPDTFVELILLFCYNWNYLYGNSFLLLCCGKGCRLAYPPSRTLVSQLVKALVISLLSIIALKIIFVFVELNIPNVHIW